MRVFISYFLKNGKDYAKLNEILDAYEHDSFFADHDTLLTGSIWEINPK
jgi:hypothetical protein